MPEQRMHSALAPIDVLTRAELDATLTHRFDSFIRDWYRGEDYVEYNGNGNGATILSLPGPDSGYAWALKTVALVVNSGCTVDVYLGDNTATAPIGEQITTGPMAAIFTWSSNQVVFKDQRNLTVVVSTGGINAWKIVAKQVPGEMIGKL
jgi:hypothetical protein